MAEEITNTLANTNVRNTLSSNSNTSYCSLAANTLKEKAMAYNAMANPQKRLSDCINLTLNVRDVFVELIELADELTGEVTQAPRIVLIDTENVTYQAVSKGIYNSLARLIQTFDEPTWEGGLPLRVKQIPAGKNQILTLEVDLDALQ